MAWGEGLPLLSLRKTSSWCMVHPGRLQMRLYPFRTMIHNFLFYPLPSGFDIDLTFPLSHISFLASLGRLSPPWEYSSTQQPEIPTTPTQCASLCGETRKNMMSLGWVTSQNLGSKGLESKVPVVWLGQTWKPADTPILPAFATINQPVPQLTGGAYDQKFDLKNVQLG